MALDRIKIKGAREHNLKNINLEIPRDKLVVITGLSGSGKSSLAFDTIYAEGQRRYVESLSTYARQFLEQMEKPDVDAIEGLSPAISIEQKTASRNPRSTVATVTEIYDYLRLLYARAGEAFCYRCGKKIASQSISQMVDQIMELASGTRIHILAPVVRGRKGEYRKELAQFREQGFLRVKVDGQMRETSEEIVLNRKRKHTLEVVVDRMVIKPAIQARLADSFSLATNLAKGLATVEILGGESMVFSQQFACQDCGVSFPEISPRLFSFNNPYGACPACDGLGFKRDFNPDLIVADKSLSLREGVIQPWSKRHSVYFLQLMEALAAHYRFSIHTPFKKLKPEQQRVILHGSGDERIRLFYYDGDRKHFYQRPFEGIVPYLKRRYKETGSEAVRGDIEQYMSNTPCDSCHGARLKPESLHIKVNGLNISELTSFSIKEAEAFFANLILPPRRAEVARRILKEIRERLSFLVNVGLDYLTLDRMAGTLAGGEGQRIRLATQIGSSLMGVLYILDEPSIGLHQRDNTRLLNTLKRLRDMGNSVLVVEHDEQTIKSADYIIDMGPGAGPAGGHIVACGSSKQIMANSNSLTGQYLSRRLTIPVPARRPSASHFLTLKRARQNNLKNLDVSIPLGRFTCVTGVSGSGKSSLIIDTLYRALAQKIHRSRETVGAHDEITGLDHLDKVIDIDQSPIGRTPRSNPVTYTGVFTFIRELFAQLPESRVRGYRPGRFSFNVHGGRCEACTGDGIIRIEMHFLPDVFVSCDGCRGKRYNRETLEIRYRGKNIADILDMTVTELLKFMENIPRIRHKLRTLEDVGLGYIKLGQPATTLSGGEAQRIKLSKELSRRSTGQTIYILDEPTTGLHFADIQKLLDVLNRLVDQGNTVVVIEHNLEVIKTADYIIDLGPEGGDKGGEMVATGTPEEVAKNPKSYTGYFLKRILNSRGRQSRAS